MASQIDVYGGIFRPPLIGIAHRHGESAGNLIVGDKKGHTDYPLTDTGKGQGRRLGHRLSSEPIHAIISSPLQRALDTAKISSEGRNIPIITTNLLIERYFGDEFEINGMTDQMFLEQHLEKLRRELRTKSREDLQHLRLVPTMENDSEVVKRIDTVIYAAWLLFGGKTVQFSTHGNALRTWLIEKNYATRIQLGDGTLDNTGYVKFITDGRRVVFIETEGIQKTHDNGHNDISYEFLRLHFNTKK